MTQIVSKAEFARITGYDRAYVTRLAQADRLVLSPDGKRVLVAASKRRIKETEDPNRDDVRTRHAKAREEKPAAPQTPEDPELKRVARGFNAARAEKEHYLAQTAKLEFERAIGKLVETVSVQHAGAEAGTALRARLENLADQLAPLIAPITDESEVRRLLDDHIEVILTELADKFAGLAAEMVGKEKAA